MRTNNNKKKTNMSSMTRLKRELKRSYVNELRKDCEALVSISKEERDEKNYLDYNEKAERKEFSKAYRMAKLHFNHLVDLGEERTATLIFGRNAFECVEFRCAEKEYVKIHPEAGGFFDQFKYYDYTNKEKCSEESVEARKSKKEPRLNMASKTRNSRHKKSRKVAIAIIVALLAVIAFVVAVCKKGLKPVIKACLYGFAMISTIFVFEKAKRDAVEKIHDGFYGDK